MEETFVTFKTAKLARKKGLNFILNKDGNCIVYNLDSPNKETTSYHVHTEFPNKNKYIFAPAQSLLLKWLIDKHKIYIEVKLNEYLFKRLYEHSNKHKCLKWRYVIYCNINDKDYSYESFSSKKTYSEYEKCLEKGLEEALKLI